MSRTRRRPIRAVARFVAAVMTVSGLLLSADAAATLLWQEPISALLVQREQRELEQALANPPKRVREGRPLPGDAIAKIEIPVIEVDQFVVEGTDISDLRRGPGHYADTPLPGEGGTAGIAGHRTTYGAPFRRIDQLDRGDRIVVHMPGERLIYRVQARRIVSPEQTEVKRPVGYDRLLLSACHPLYSATERIVVFARLARRDQRSDVRG